MTFRFSLLIGGLRRIWLRIKPKIIVGKSYKEIEDERNVVYLVLQVRLVNFRNEVIFRWELRQGIFRGGIGNTAFEKLKHWLHDKCNKKLTKVQKNFLLIVIFEILFQIMREYVLPFQLIILKLNDVSR